MFGDLTRVGANFHAMEAWSNLKRVNGDIGQIQSRLSTGKRINSAEDDTSGYALSKHLESRTRGLSQALDNVGTAKNVLNIAEGGYQSQMSILQTIKEIEFPHSIGLLYTAFTYYLGFKVNSGEYKVMGLAPYGDPKYKNLIFKELLDLKEDGTFRLNMKYFNYATGLTMTNTKFSNLFGNKRRDPDKDHITQFHMDIAASVQVVIEEIILKIGLSFTIKNLVK